MAFLTAELKDKKERLSEIDRRLDRLSRQHEMCILDDAQLLERSSEVARDGKEMRARVHELEDILTTSARWGVETASGLAKDFQDAFRLPEGTWQRLAEKLNLRMLVYPPDQNDVAGQSVKATLRITGEFPAAAATKVTGSAIETATISTPSLLHVRQRHL